MDAWLAAAPQPAARDGAQHPVEDFLFTYYSHRPAQLRRWHPGAGVGPGRRPRTGARLGATTGSTATGAVLDVRPLLGRARRDSVRWIRDLLAATAARPAQLGCFGLHEWAMVYRQDPEQVRHAAWPLRLGADGHRRRSWSRTGSAAPTSTRTASSRRRPGRCNPLQPTRETQPTLEQPGCLHANMDLYKWAYKLGPLVAERAGRGLLRAGPRDPRAGHARARRTTWPTLGYGRCGSRRRRARPSTPPRSAASPSARGALRARLVDACDRLLGAGASPRPIPGSPVRA